jgi:hypothetical protein
MNIDILKIHYDMNALEIIKNIQVESKLPKMNDPKTKIEYLIELAVKIFDINLNVEHILTKYLSLY